MVGNEHERYLWQPKWIPLWVWRLQRKHFAVSTKGFSLPAEAVSRSWCADVWRSVLCPWPHLEEDVSLLLLLHFSIRETIRPHLILKSLPNFSPLDPWMPCTSFWCPISHIPGLSLETCTAWPFWMLHNICLFHVFSATDKWLFPLYFTVV